MKLNDNKNLPEFLYNKIIHILFSAIYININITDLEKNRSGNDRNKQIQKIIEIERIKNKCLKFTFLKILLRISVNFKNLTKLNEKAYFLYHFNLTISLKSFLDRSLTNLKVSVFFFSLCCIFLKERRNLSRKLIPDLANLRETFSLFLVLLSAAERSVTRIY